IIRVVTRDERVMRIPFGISQKRAVVLNTGIEQTWNGRTESTAQRKHNNTGQTDKIFHRALLHKKRTASSRSHEWITTHGIKRPRATQDKQKDGKLNHPR